MTIQEIYKERVKEVVMHMTQEERRWVMAHMTVKKEMYKSSGKIGRLEFCNIAIQCILDTEHLIQGENK